MAGVAGVAGCTGGSAASPVPTAAAPPTPDTSPTAGGCGTTTAVVGELPEWTGPVGLPGGRYVTSHEGNAVGVIFASSLRSGPIGPTDASNKILWIVQEPRKGNDLRLTLRPLGGTEPTVRITEQANSSPGEIYPSSVDVPTPGCWSVLAEWNGNVASFELAYS